MDVLKEDLQTVGVMMLGIEADDTLWQPQREMPKEEEYVDFIYFSNIMFVCTFFQGSQSGSVHKEMGVFSKGQVQMSATVNKKICSPGKITPVMGDLNVAY